MTANVTIGYMIRAPTWDAAGSRRQPLAFLQQNTAAPPTFRRRGEPAIFGGLMTAAVMKTGRRFFALFSGSRTAAEKEKFYGIF